MSANVRVVLVSAMAAGKHLAPAGLDSWALRERGRAAFAARVRSPIHPVVNVIAALEYRAQAHQVRLPAGHHRALAAIPELARVAAQRSGQAVEAAASAALPRCPNWGHVLVRRDRKSHGHLASANLGGRHRRVPGWEDQAVSGQLPGLSAAVMVEANEVKAPDRPGPFQLCGLKPALRQLRFPRCAFRALELPLRVEPQGAVRAGARVADRVLGGELHREVAGALQVAQGVDRLLQPHVPQTLPDALSADAGPLLRQAVTGARRWQRHALSLNEGT